MDQTMKDIFASAVTPAGYSDIEWKARVELALCYRMVDYYGWTTQVYNHISYRIPGTEHLLINAFGLLYSEITPSNLVKIDFDGNKVDDSPYPINKAGSVIHTALHKGRPDVHCVMHTHNPDVQAVSALKCGFMPLYQEAFMFYDRIGYHDFEGIVLDESEQQRLVDSLGPTNHTLMLNNHGVVTTGPDVAWAFMRMYQIIQGCQVQLKVMASGSELLQASEEAMIKTREQFEGGDAQGGAEVRLPEWPAYYRLMSRLDPNWIR
ncbi:class II aldolase/adducin family protein [Psychrobacter fulvigenes]|uniref:class II aldolase/adducin family protein n=1 Tax=Psychrobacter fulvigenes TaxID=533323 RepID=UPI001D117F86|nr:class II aldolase/adducin family protein [Psychrobacter fulvigenes]